MSTVKYIIEFLIISGILLGIFGFISKYYDITYALGISECKTFPNNTLDYNSCKIVPGSLVVIVTKDSPFFGVYNSNRAYAPLIIISVILIGIGAYILTRAAASFIEGKPIHTIIYTILSAICISTSTVMLGGIVVGKDIVCYKKNQVIICHTLIKIEDNYFYLQPSRYPNVIEKVPYEDIYGKIVLAIPDIGGIIYSLQIGWNITRTLSDLIKQGYIPEKIYIKSIVES